jgi:hypothetical protein
MDNTIDQLGNTYEVVSGQFTVEGDSANLGVSSKISLVASGAILSQLNASAPQNNRLYRQFVDSVGTMHFSLTTDSGTGASDWMSITRTSLAAGTLTVEAANVVLHGTGSLYSQKGVISNQPSGTPVFLFAAIAQIFTVYLVTASVAPSNDPANYNTVALFTTNGSVGRLTILQSGALMTLSVSGTSVLGAQASGAPNNINWYALKLV